MWIKPNNSNLLYSGRIDWTDVEHPIFVFPCTSVQFRFIGDHLQINLQNRHIYWDNYVGCIVDGVEFSFLLSNEGTTMLTIPLEKNNNSLHEVLLFKRQDSCHEIVFSGIEISGIDCELLAPFPRPKRKIEVYGDSVSAGEVSEAITFVGQKDPEHQGEFSNSYYSYAWLTARKLNAQIHDIAQGGIALMDGTGWYAAPFYKGMESVWDKVHYAPELGKPTLWDFGLYAPDVVIIALGQNDSHPEDYMAEDILGEKAIHWRKTYQIFLEKLKNQYPEAHMICCTTLLNHSPQWDASIKEVVQELGDPMTTHYLFARNGTGTPGHLRISEAEEMAEELSQYILTLPIQAWKE